ncbi:hypothetical protein TWF281_004711 [Arthrobotrys megalospora]
MKFLLLLISLLPATILSSTLTPATIPLFVRNPYLSLWLQNARQEPWSRWPMFWTGMEIGFGVMLRVNNTVYPLLGKPHDSLDSDNKKEYTISFPEYHGVDFDASTTWLKYSVGEKSSGGGGWVDVKLTFTSPVTVNDTMRQSIPAGYLEVEVEGDVDCEVYADVNGLWVTGDRGSHIQWEMVEHGGLRSWKVTRSREEHFSEKWDRAEWGSLYFTAPKSIHFESNDSGPMRRRFAKGSSLRNATDTHFREVMDAEPVFAFSKSFHLSGNDSAPRYESAIFTIAHIQDEVARFASARGITNMRPLWKGFFDDHLDLIHFHYHDYSTASAEADKFNKQLVEHASRAMSGVAAETYTEILLLSTRQVLGGTSFSGTPSRPLLFLKEISSDGNFQTIDVIFPAFPFFLYVNPSWLRYLLEPLLEHQSAGLYPNDYSMHDLGSSFPNATGHPDGRDEYMPVEECGNMLIMGASVVGNLVEENGGGEKGRKVAKEWLEGAWGDGGRFRGRYDLWRKWTGYLVEFGLLPATQLSTDDFAGRLANQTNLALKGILGIKAMAELAAVVGNTKDEKHFSDIADKYIKTWHSLAISRDGTHTKLAYHWQGSWGTLYNLYADSLLCYRKGLESPLAQFSTLKKSSSTRKGRFQRPLDGSDGGDDKPSGGFVPEDIYTRQSNWYNLVEQKYGLPLDSRHLYTKSDWEFFAAAISARKTRERIILDVGRWVNETSTDRPFTDLYDTEGSGAFPGIWFMARPVVGGHFAVLALERACGGKGLQGLEYGDDVWAMGGGEVSTIAGENKKTVEEGVVKGEGQVVFNGN